MARTRSTFRQAEVTRIVRAFEAAGAKVERAEMDLASGKLVLVFSRAENDPDPPNPWDADCAA